MEAGFCFFPHEATSRKLGILLATVQQALQVRQKFSWAAKVPEEVWRDYVLPYASVNEARWGWLETSIFSTCSGD